MINELSEARRRILITGGTSGLGLELVKLLISRGHNVFVTGRDSSGLPENPGLLRFLKVDFGSLSEVAEAAHEIMETTGNLDIIVNNAGVLSPPVFTSTNDKFEYTFQINFLSHLLLNAIIVEKQPVESALLIVSVTSPVIKTLIPSFTACSESNYQPFRAYTESKIYPLFIGDYLAEKFPGGGDIRHFGFNPGIFRSGIFRMKKKWFHIMYNIAAPFMKDPSEAARILSDILMKPDIINGGIYKTKDNFRLPENLDKAMIGEFMDRCFVCIESFIR